MTTLISLDLETYSKTDLLACGAYRYATCPSTDVLVASMIVNGRIVRWRPGQPHPFHGHPIDDIRIAAWNSQFERLLWWYVLSPDYDWPVLPLEAFQCTSAQARAMAAGPAKLETAARFFGRPFQKDMKGHRHMLTMCRPAPEKLQLEFLKSGGDPQAAERCHHTLAALDRLHDYCDDDTRTEHGIAAILPPWTLELLAQFHESERINDHGLGVDVAFARAAMDYAEDEKAYYARRMTEMTGGKIKTPRQFAAIKTWLLPQLSPAAITVTEYYEHGQKKTTLDADTRGNLLDEAAGDPEFLTGDSATGDTVLEFLEVLEGAGKSTISKYEAIANRAVRGIHDERPRVHGSYMYAGAAQSGRYSSTGIQLHNLVRKLPPNAPALIKAFKSGDDDAVLSEVEIWACALEAKSGKRASREPIHALGQLVRPTIRGCPKGDFDLIWGDWSSIEAVMLPWLSGDPQADAYLDVFRRGEDIYCHQASAILGRTITKADEAERQSYGKVPVLACGYQGGVGAFQQMARGYGVRVDDEQAMHIVEGWRDANEWAAGVRVRGKGRVGGFWNDLNSAAMAAVADNDNRWHEVGRLAYRFDRDALDGIGSLYCRLPSDREIPYPGARIQMVEKFGKTGFGLTALKAAWRPKKDESEWPRISLYGGILAENATQGSATGCLLNSALIRARAAGLTVCGHTHDEIIIESADPSRDKPVLHTVMTARPGWPGDDRLPLRADVDYGYRYKVKDTH